jgi:hypothetical protein
VAFGLVGPVVVLGGLIALMLPAIHAAREAAQRAQARRALVATKGMNRPIDVAATQEAGLRLNAHLPAPVPARENPLGPAAMLKQLREGDLPARLSACSYLALGPKPDEPLRAEVAKALERLLMQPQDELREPSAALKALVKWATIDNLPALATAVWSEDAWVKRHAQEALDRLRAAADPQTQQAIDEAMQRGRGAAHADAIQLALKTAGDGEISSRLRALDKLEKERVDPKFQGAVITTMSALLTHPDARVRMNALEVLDAWAGPDDRRAMLELVDDESDSVRSRAILALGKTKDPEVIDKVVALAEQPRLQGAIDAAVRSFGPEAEPAVLRLLANGSDRARVSACQLLQASGTEKCLPALREAQQSPDPRLQQAARRASRVVERRLGLPSSPTPAPMNKSRPRSTPKRGSTRQPKQNSKTSRDPNATDQR